MSAHILFKKTGKYLLGKNSNKLEPNQDFRQNYVLKFLSVTYSFSSSNKLSIWRHPSTLVFFWFQVDSACSLEIKPELHNNFDDKSLYVR